MLGDAELQELSDQLNAFGLASRTHHNIIQDLLQKYQNLVENYRSLKSDYEEEKESREKYKKLARGQERNPFVLVLVDGDGYIFRDHLVKARGAGGVSAAQLLSKAIKGFLSKLGSDADQYRVMIRIYANLVGLSNKLARAGLAGNEARSLAPFTASFTRSHELFDFVDVGDKKEGVDFKIREMFRLFADSGQCKHIFFAGCHDPGYLSLLMPYRSKTDRITLVKADSFSSEYRDLDLPIVDLSSVFRSTISNGRIPTPVTEPTLKPNVSENVCKFFQRGRCKFGDLCTKVHIINTEKFKMSDDYTTQQPDSPVLSQSTTNQLNPPSRRQSISSMLPTLTVETEGLIPVNKDGERIDTVLPKPPPKAWDLYKERSKIHKPCNAFHLGGRCPNTSCGYDHDPLDPSAVYVMKYILKEYSCPRGGKCRSAKCYYGHICQRDGCQGGRPCKFKPQFHDIDPNVAEWLSPDDRVDDQSVTDGQQETFSIYENFTPAPQLAASPTESESGW